jgi:two-component system, response regulator
MPDNLILLVEDDPDDEELAATALADANIRVAVARDGQQALDYLFGQGSYAGEEIEPPRVVFLDLNLPKLNGLEVLRRVRQDPRTSILPVVIMTSSREEEDRVSSYRTGANSYVRKPLDFDKFRTLIRQLGLYWLGVNDPAYDR